MSHGKPAMPVQSCWLTHLTYPDIRRFKGKIPLICIGSVPKNAEIYGQTEGRRTENSFRLSFKGSNRGPALTF